ncbi:hypothetical protein TNCV_3162651 [Trichonephila clavipes]|nr:hypothetical protein TNCV_3162651 [Trichonephila clavipes]
MFDSSSYVIPTPLAHADILRDVLPRGGVGLLPDRGRHELSPPPQFRHLTGVDGYILQPPASVISAATSHKTFGPTELTGTYFLWTRKVFGGIEPRPSGLESNALTTRLPTTLFLDLKTDLLIISLDGK